jgi:type VI secretion system protein VasJ
MLGLGKLKNTWDWAACGKHPVARDYLRIGLTTSLLVAFESWIEEGYQILKNRQTSDKSLYSWRFWAKGIKKGSLVCGVAKESSDSIGRPYPLLVMGDGILEGWEEDWDLLHDVFENTWDQIESIFSKHYDDLKNLENEVCTIENPCHYWLELKSKNRIPSKPESLVNALTISMSHDEIREKVRYLSNKMEVHIPLDNQTIGDPSNMADLWCSLLKSHSSGVPSAVFMGGIPEKNFLILFNRSLNTNDFVRLWSGFSL